MTSALLDISGIGNACMDIVADCDMDFIARHKVHKSHCVYVDFDALEKLKSELKNPEWIAGGSAANTVYTYQLLGGGAAFLGKIADDTEGRAFEKSMTDIGIHAALTVDTTKNTGSTQVVSLRTPDGDRSFVTYQGVAETIAPQDIDYNTISKSRIAYFDGYTMYSPQALEVFLKAARTAHAHNNLAVFNPGDLSIVQLYKKQVDELLMNVDILICNLAEANALFGTTSLAEASTAMRDKFVSGAVTDGANGAAVFKNGDILMMNPPAHALTEIHTLGAGDHFAAGFLYGQTHDMSLTQSARLAELCALDCLSHAGARPLKNLQHLVAEARQI